MKPSKIYNKILIFNPAFLGDTVLTTPLIRLVRKLFPKSEIYFCIRPEHIGLFNGINLINGLIPFDKRNAHKGLRGFLSFRELLLSYRFDLVIDLHRSIRSTVLCAFLCGARVIGFKSAVLSVLFNDKIQRDMFLQEAERNLMMASAFCDDFSLPEAKKSGGPLTCFIDESLLSKIRHFYTRSSNGEKIIGIAPGSVWNTKKYLSEYFAKAAEMLCDAGYSIALFGGSEDKNATDAFKNYYKGNFYDFAEKTTLRELPAFLASLDALLVNDSGAMHIAIAAGVPCVAVFGPTVKSLGFFPYDTKSVVIENNNLDCRPCSLHGGNKCPLGHFLCMKTIKPEIVAEAAIRVLKASK